MPTRSSPPASPIGRGHSRAAAVVLGGLVAIGGALVGSLAMLARGLMWLGRPLLWLLRLAPGLLRVLAPLLRLAPGLLRVLAPLWRLLQMPVGAAFRALAAGARLAWPVLRLVAAAARILGTYLWVTLARSAIPAAVAALKLLWAAVLANPIAWLIGLVAGAIWVLTHWEETVAAVSRAWEWLIEQLGFDPIALFQQKWAGVTAWFSAKWDAIVATAAGLYDRFMQVGQNIVGGLWAGVESKYGEFRLWFGDKIWGLFGTAQDATDSHSPSRLFARLGSDIVRGLELGISARERFPALALGNLSRGLAGAVGGVGLGLGVAAMPAAASLGVAAMPAAASLGVAAMPAAASLGVAAMPAAASLGGGSAAHGAPISITNNITITAPAGADARAIAELVKREVSGATRAASAHIARLYDSTDNL